MLTSNIQEDKSKNTKKPGKSQHLPTFTLWHYVAAVLLLLLLGKQLYRFYKHPETLSSGIAKDTLVNTATRPPQR